MLPKPISEMFSATIPSTGKKVKFRAFNVREEKALLLAKEADDVSMMVEAIKNLIEGCTDGKADASSLAMFDIEYLLTQIRARSVGEIVKLLLPCTADSGHERALVSVDLTKMQVMKHEGHNKKFMIDSSIGIVMKYPSIDDIEGMEKSDDISAITACIDYIFDQDQVYSAKDIKAAELEEWVSTNLKKSHVEKIKNEFFRTMPNFSHVIDYKCPTCGHDNKKIIKGTASFFV